MFRLFNSRKIRDENIQANIQSSQNEQTFKFRSHLFSTTSALVSLCCGQSHVTSSEEELLQALTVFKV